MLAGYAIEQARQRKRNAIRAVEDALVELRVADRLLDAALHGSAPRPLARSDGDALTIDPSSDAKWLANVTGSQNGFRGCNIQRPNGVQGVRLYTGTGLFVTDCTISGDGDGVVRIDGDVVRPMMTGNMFTGANVRAEVFHTANTSLGVTCNNAGDLRTIGQFAKLGDRTIWADSAGRLRIITGPTANIDSDGTVVGTQT